MYTRLLSSGTAAAFLVLLPLFAVGCGSATRTAAAVGAGGAAAVVMNDQNAEGEASGSVADVERRTRAVFASMGLEITKSSAENNDTERELEGRSGDRVVHVKVERPAGSQATKVSVSSRRGTTLDYDVSHARTVLQRIQQP
ncbi:MAG TPA: hypothetical protein VFQ76_20700 [Longimicrobiaceae bacterium]|nr:hypothetical protein [Longimicrobiaceae bacterium]